jgi:hypothetical protein
VYSVSVYTIIERGIRVVGFFNFPFFPTSSVMCSHTHTHMEKVFAGQAVTNRERQNGGYEVGEGGSRDAPGHACQFKLSGNDRRRRRLVILNSKKPGVMMIFQSSSHPRYKPSGVRKSFYTPCVLCVHDPCSTIGR